MLPRQSYAPTPHSYVPNTAIAASISLDEEVQLAGSRAERDLHDSLAELFSIVVMLDELERAFFKDAVPEAEYGEICERALKQYRSILADDTVARAFVGLEEFKAEWELEVPRATERIRVGLPATAISANPPDRLSSPRARGDPSSRTVALGAGLSGQGGGMGGVGVGGGAASAPGGTLILEATQDFITFLDAIKLGLLSKDQLYPLLSDVIQSVNRVTDREFDCRGKIVHWLIALNQMRVTDELTVDQARELEMDIQQAYQGFKRILT